MGMSNKIRTGKSSPSGAPSKPSIPKASSKMCSEKSKGVAGKKGA